MDAKTFNAAKERNICGVCATRWGQCRCDEGARTESIDSLLNNVHIFPNRNSRHLCVFLYHTYQRWTDTSDLDDFSVGCLPPWEGWYAAWLKPSNNDVAHQPHSDNMVLPCTVQYCDGTSADGFIDISGDLMVKLPGPRTPGALHYDPDRHIVISRVGVTQCLTLDEIANHTRGVVHNMVKVSHIIPQKDADKVLVSKLPKHPSHERETAIVSTQRVQSYTPHLYEEIRWRTRRRFTKRAGATVQRFLYKLFLNAALGDGAARYALQRKWIDARTAPNTQLNILMSQVRRLTSVPDPVTESIDSRADELQGEGDESRPRKRLRK